MLECNETQETKHKIERMRMNKLYALLIDLVAFYKVEQSHGIN